MENTADSTLKFLMDHEEVKSGESLHFVNSYSKFHSNCHGLREDLARLEASERIHLTKEFFHWEPPPDGSENFQLLQRYTKSENFSTLFRQAGNEHYRRRDFPPALREYNLAVMFGVPGEGHLALAYGNRSAILMEMGHPALALSDIEYGLTTNKCGSELEAKLHTRRRKCNEMTLGLKKVENEKEPQDHGFKLTRPNPKVRQAQSFVKIDSSEECGRKLVVTEHVSCGSLLLMEEPFAVSLENELTFDTVHCHRCFIKILAGVPCSHCPFAMYCSRECLEDASQRFHQYEHRILPYFYSQGMRQRDLLILRIICMAGSGELWELFKSSPDLKEKEGLRSGVKGEDPKTEVYESRYYQIHHLLLHSDPGKDFDATLDSIFRSFLLVSLLAEYSTFFSNLSPSFLGTESETRQFKGFVVALILDHYESTPFNAVGFNEIGNDESGVLRSIPLGTGLFPTISLINHSCAPNAIHVRGRRKCETAVISVRALNPGDEITITYGPRFSLLGRSTRREELGRKYNFFCRCVACEEDWPTSSSRNLEPIKCPTCDNQNFISCSTCIEIRSRVERLEEIHERLTKNNDEGDSSSYQPTLRDLAACIEFFDVNFTYNFQYTQIAQELFKKALLLGISCSNQIVQTTSNSPVHF